MERSSLGRRVAFFGGSFDPPHLGHLAVARAARDALKLDTVLFAPVGAQPLKPHGSTAPFADRLAMTKQAIVGESGFEISLADAPSSDGKPNYTLETLRSLRAEVQDDGSLFCLMGADSFVGLRKWRGASEIPFAAALIVASRPGQRIDDLAGFLPHGLTMETLPAGGENVSRAEDAETEVRAYQLRNAEGQSAPFYLLPGLDVEISASDIRGQIRSSVVDPDPNHKLLPTRVAEYIQRHGLYR